MAIPGIIQASANKTISLRYKYTWNQLSVYQQMNPGSFKNNSTHKLFV